MSLFVCDECHCIENTATGRYHTRHCRQLWGDDNVGKAVELGMSCGIAFTLKSEDELEPPLEGSGG